MHLAITTDVMWCTASCEFALSILSPNPRRSLGRLCLQSHCHHSNATILDTEIMTQKPEINCSLYFVTGRDLLPEGMVGRISNLKPPTLRRDLVCRIICTRLKKYVLPYDILLNVSCLSVGQGHKRPRNGRPSQREKHRDRASEPLPSLTNRPLHSFKK